MPLESDETHLSPPEFIKRIVKEAREGKSFVPFLGSGISKRSGIPMGKEFTDYLRWALLRALGLPASPLEELTSETFDIRDWLLGNEEHNLKNLGYWNFVRRGWPPHPTQGQIAATKAWVSELYRFATMPLGRNCSEAAKRFQSLVGEGLGTLHDWKSTLVFISRMKLKNKILLMEAPQTAVIDAYNVFITRGRRPNLAHFMLAYLTRPLRVHTILTTNFDEMIEDAFSQVGAPLRVFDVSAKGGLPDCRIVRIQDSLIKLHGGMFETRADYSVDSRPNFDDCENFLGYLSERIDEGDDDHGGEEKPIDKPKATAKCLLVLGYSMGDARVRHLLQYLLEVRHNSPERLEGLKIFWLGHSQRGVDDVRKRLGLKKSDEDFFISTCQPRPDLLLLELYQKVTLSLPPGGLQYDYSNYVAPRSDSHVPGLEPTIKAISQLISDSSKACEDEAYPLSDGAEAIIRSHKEYEGRLIEARGGFGISTVFSACFWKDSARVDDSLWFETCDFISPKALWRTILQSLSDRMGWLRLEPLDYDNQTPSSFEALRRLLRMETKRYFIYLNERIPSGINAGFKETKWPPAKESEWPDPCPEYEIAVRNLLDLGLVVIRLRSEPDHHPSARLSTQQDPDEPKEPAPVEGLGDAVPDAPHGRRSDGSFPCHDVIINDLRAWIGTDAQDTSLDSPRGRLRFLYALSLIRHPRHPSLSIAEGVIDCRARFDLRDGDRDEERAAAVERWIEELVKKRVFHLKHGMFLWMDWEVRRRVRELCLEIESKHFTGQACVGRSLKQRSARTHFWIAEWYFKALQASSHPIPLVESIYHYIRCLSYATGATYPTLPEKGFSDSSYQSYLARMAIAQIGRVLSLSKRVILFWFSSEETFEAIQKEIEQITRGFSPELKSVLQLQLDAVTQEIGRICNVIRCDRGDHYFMQRRWPSLQVPNAEEERGAYDDLVAKGTHTLDRLEQARKAVVALGVSDKDSVPLLASTILQEAAPDPDHVRTIVDRWLSDGSQSVAKSSSLILQLARTLLLGAQINVERAYRWEHCLECCEKDLAKFKVLKVPKGFSKLEALRERHQKLWTHVCSLCMMCLRLARHLDASQTAAFEWLNLRARNLYGLAFGKRNRFYEANRKLDEAMAFLGASRIYSSDKSEWGKICLRRAEIYTVEAEGLIAKGEIGQKLGAALDDAWAFAELAELGLKKEERSTWWWSRLNVIKLKILAYISENEEKISRDWLADRRRFDRVANASHLVRRALLLPRTQLFRQVRLVHYYTRVLRAISKNHLREVLPGDLEIMLRSVFSAKVDHVKDDLEKFFYQHVCNDLLEAGILRPNDYMLVDLFNNNSVAAQE